MDWLNTIVTAVRDLGFPVACVCALFFLLYQEMQDRKDRDMKFTEILERNTAAINSLEKLVQSLHKED